MAAPGALVRHRADARLPDGDRRHRRHRPQHRRPRLRLQPPANPKPTQEPPTWSAPKTLLESGADLRPAAAAISTLVIIDAQNEYLDGKLALPWRAAVHAVARLLAKARAAGAPVVHVQHKGRAGGCSQFHARGGAIIDAATPVGGESIVSKPLPNALLDGPGRHVKQLSRTQLVIAGRHDAHARLSSTALDLGYKATVAADAAATRDLPDPMGGVIAADALHRAALAELADRFAIVTAVDRISEK